MMSAKSGKKLSTKYRQRRRKILERKRIYSRRKLEMTFIPPGFEAINKAIVGFTKTIVKNSGLERLLEIEPIRYSEPLSVKMTVTMKIEDAFRFEHGNVRCVTCDFKDDVAHPDFFNRLEKFLVECIDTVSTLNKTNTNVRIL